ncbi:MAG: cAMP/cGMP-dependent 3',5'-cyclic-AMP/GMP phosphodiesterase [Syntrophaceae bacterium]|jgi:CRP-like cAMP-binding protein|nr:cAMP/cGMP-dependent 3',5'-cyclic-AMP/GMP phosphodiesterase [Syntrophaceae bacterium]
MNKSKGNLVHLTRGGILIPTSAGNMQLGIPPETIKDTMQLQDGVPDTFIIPRDMFDLQNGVALAEMEFPIYFNFFIKKGKAKIICTEIQKKRIETVISEALFGPETIDHLPEFADGENTSGFPDLKAEMNHFRSTAKNSQDRLNLEDMIEFHILDVRKRATCNGRDIRFDKNYNLTVYEKGKEIAFIGHDLPLMPVKNILNASRLNFRPPLFGVTTLGAGHGFDPHADTSGLIIWVNRRGIMVDPPVNASEKLLALGVSPKLIENVVLTHCHADHDAGTLQKILQEGTVNLYTTKTIYRSFMKKAEALTGIEESLLSGLVHFYPVFIGKPMIIDGGRFHFNYTLHSIPTISIQASLSGKSMVYSSDTMNDPQYIEQLYQEGILSKNRRDFLLNFAWDHDVIFHEAGIPPIHTPLSYLCSLPEQVRKRMYLVHVNPETIPPDSGMKIAPTGLANTIELDIRPLPHDEAIEMLDAFSRVDLFEKLSLEKAREFLLVAKVEKYDASGFIFRKGEKGDKFYIVVRGEVDIILNGKIVTTYNVGGYFGEKSLFLDENRTATATAKTDTVLLSIRKDEMLSLIRGTASEFLLRQIADFQNIPLRDTLKKNPILGNLTATQQTQLHGLIRPVDHCFQPGEMIAGKGQKVYIVREGKVSVQRGRVLVDTLTKGAIFGVRALFKNNIALSFAAKDETSLYDIDRSDFINYLKSNPGIYVKMYHWPY